jgi:PhzF family phenazine biosynthesis protein
MTFKLRITIAILILLVQHSIGQIKTTAKDIKLYQVDSFAESVFKGNPAAVCPLDKWLPDSVMQNIAMENNHSETAFYVKEKDGYRIRWFTPTTEVDLCGHGTLATAFVMFNYENVKGNSISFRSKSGLLSVNRTNNLLTLDFPADSIVKVELTDELKSCFKENILEVYQGRLELLFVFESEEMVRNCKPDLAKILSICGGSAIITAKGSNVDFVSRVFSPGYGIDEDPVTGSSHTTITKYWSSKLNKNEFQAEQASKRGGKLICRPDGNRVKISGQAKLYSIGTIFID